MPRFFTLQQAEELLPGIDEAIREAIGCKAECDRVELERRQVTQRVAALGGMHVDRVRLIQEAARSQQAARALEQAVQRIHGFGCLLKDLDIGLVDFPTLFGGEEVYLCWKLGESGIRFWHPVSEGFRGRRAIDAQFLESHRGESLT